MKVQEQLEKWVAGESLHNDERDECCPDFSCCENIETPQEVKDRFLKAWNEKDEETTHELLMGFLGEMVQKKTAEAGPDTSTVYIAGDKSNLFPTQ